MSKHLDAVGRVVCAIFLCGLSASVGQATTLVQYQGGPDPDSFSGIIAVGWQQAIASQDVTVSAPFFGSASPGTFSAYLTTSIGPGTGLANQIAASTVTIPPSPGIAFSSVLFSGLDLAPGSYYVVVDTAGAAVGWAGDMPAAGGALTAPGFAYLGAYALDGSESTGYDPADPYSLLGDGFSTTASLDFDVSSQTPATPEPNNTHLTVCGISILAGCGLCRKLATRATR